MVRAHRLGADRRRERSGSAIAGAVGRHHRPGHRRDRRRWRSSLARAGRRADDRPRRLVPRLGRARRASGAPRSTRSSTGCCVRDVMDRDVTDGLAGLTVDTFADQVLDGSAAPRVPGRPGRPSSSGSSGRGSSGGVRRDRWATTRVEDVMVTPPTTAAARRRRRRSDGARGARPGRARRPAGHRGRPTGRASSRAARVAAAVRLRRSDAGEDRPVTTRRDRRAGPPAASRPHATPCSRRAEPTAGPERVADGDALGRVRGRAP